MSHVSLIHESCLSFLLVMSHRCIGTKLVMSLLSISHVSFINQSCLSKPRVMSHRCIGSTRRGCLSGSCYRCVCICKCMSYMYVRVYVIQHTNRRCSGSCSWYVCMCRCMSYMCFCASVRHTCMYVQVYVCMCKCVCHTAHREVVWQRHETGIYVCASVCHTFLYVQVCVIQHTERWSVGVMILVYMYVQVYIIPFCMFKCMSYSTHRGAPSGSWCWYVYILKCVFWGGGKR